MKSVVCMKRHVFLTVLFMILFSSRVLAGWSSLNLGGGANHMFSVAVSSGRNDGVVRVYGACADDNIYEFSYANNAWVSPPAVVGSGVQNMNDVTAGFGRSEIPPQMHVYSANADGNIYEFTFTGVTGSPWNKISVTGGSAGGPVNSVAVGPGRSDGMMRVYGACGGAGIFEYTYTGANPLWSQTTLQAGIFLNDVKIGPGRNDNFTRVYGAGANGMIYEYSWSIANGSWSSASLVTSGSGLNGIAIGPGRNDGFNRVYAAGSNGYIYECTYSSSSSAWNQVSMGNGGTSINSVVVGTGRNDGQMHVYAARGDDTMYEYTYSNGTWAGTNIGMGGNILHKVSVGAGRNDNFIRVYGADDNDNIDEFSFSSAVVSTSTVTNTSPVLSWQQGFTNGVKQPSAAIGSVVNFAVFYQDPGGLPPLAGYPRIHIEGISSPNLEIPNSPFVMTQNTHSNT